MSIASDTPDQPMSFDPSGDSRRMEEVCRTFAGEHIAPYILELQQDLATRKALFKRMALKGLFLMCVPEEYGGTAHTFGSYATALATIARADAGVAIGMGVTNMVAESIAIYGSDFLRKKYLPAIAQGSCVPCAFALTEEKAGSDAKAIVTKAHRIGDDFVLNGEKIYLTNGDIAGMTVVIAKSRPEAGARGISAFCIDRETPGCYVSKIEDKIGLDTTSLVSVRFEDCVVPKEQLLGEEGKGFSLALSALDSGRIGIAAQAIGIAQAAYEAALFWSSEREQFGQAICQNQVIGHRLADMHTAIEAAKGLLLKAGTVKDEGDPFSVEAATAKLFATEMACTVTDQALAIFGGRGYLTSYPVERYFRDARATTIYEGTSDVQRIVIARNILKTQKNPG